MKKILLSALLLIVFSIITNAQIKKGTILLGGNIFGTYGEVKLDSLRSSKYGNIYITPVLGKAIKDNLVVGGSLGFGWNNSVSLANVGIYKSRVNTYSAGAFIRHYKNIKSSNFLFFVQGNLDVYRTYQTQYGLPVSVKSNYHATLIDASISPGLAFAVDKWLHVEIGIGRLVSLDYEAARLKTRDPDQIVSRTKELKLSTAFSSASPVYIGFRIVLPKS